jgi:ATP-dependent exoDNAse (exonuclease V) beta subunit
LTDEEAREKIKQIWQHANEFGTLLHAHAERELNGERFDVDSRIETEFQQFKAFRADFPGLVPVRTELSLFYTRDDGSVAAVGQLDALFRDEKGRFALVDYKRSEKDLGASANSFGKMGTGVVKNFPANEHHRYALQQALYAVMLEQRTGYAVDFSFLLALHPGLPRYVLILCADLRAQARAILDAL